MTSIINELVVDPAGQPYVEGDAMVSLFNEVYSMLVPFRVGHNFIGDPGTGKTHLAKELARHFAREHGVPAYYTVVDEDTTKGTVLLGHRIQDGSLVTFRAVVAQAMETGGVVIVDELTHGQLSLQSIFNTLLDQDAVTSVGDIIVQAHPLFRLITGHNTTQHPGNTGIKTSFGSRLVTWQFDYPDAATELAIVKSIVRQQTDGDGYLRLVPDSVQRYLVSWARGVRQATHNYVPVSARNVAYMVMRFATMPRNSTAPVLTKFTAGTSAEPARRKAAEWVLFHPPTTDADLVSVKVNNVFAFISQVGEENFRYAVMQCSMGLLPLHGLVPSLLKQYRTEMESSIT